MIEFSQYRDSLFVTVNDFLRHQRLSMNIVHKIMPLRNKQFIPFLSQGWPGSILNWSETDLEKFAECLVPQNVKEDKDVRLHIRTINIYQFIFYD